MIKVTISGRFAGMNEFIEANRTGRRNWNKANAMKQRGSGRAPCRSETFS